MLLLEENWPYSHSIRTFVRTAFDEFLHFKMFWTRIANFCECLYMRVYQKFLGKCSSRTNQENFIKFYAFIHPNVNWCLLTFGENTSTGGILVIQLLHYTPHVGKWFIIYAKSLIYLPFWCNSIFNQIYAKWFSN